MRKNKKFSKTNFSHSRRAKGKSVNTRYNQEGLAFYEENINIIVSGKSRNDRTINTHKKFV